MAAPLEGVEATARAVLPIVLYLRGGPPDVRRTTVEQRFAGERLASFTYWAFGLSRSDAERYLDRPEVLAPALAALMDRGRLSAARHRLESRFGSLAAATRRRVEEIDDPEELSRLANRVLDARSLDDLGL